MKPNPWALLPLGVFLFTYTVANISAGDFYKMPLTVAFIIAAVVALIPHRGKTLSARIEEFCRGSANPNILLMILIFILAGAFAQTAQAMGAVEATVQLTLALLPQKLLTAGLFVAACIISLSVGTSVGTIVALTPVAAGLAQQTGIPVPLMAAAVISGAMFGDNLSVISDTTIAATRTQGCEMADKFKTNLRMVIPFAFLTFILYMLTPYNPADSLPSAPIAWLKVVPYAAVLAAALSGMNVLLVLLCGTLFCGLLGLGLGTFDGWGWAGALNTGIQNMGELIIVSLLAGGILEMIRLNGGLEWLLSQTKRHIHSRKGAEYGMAALVSFANLCTANNTIALIITGPMAKDIAGQFHISPKRAASLLDIFSCVVQGLLPYGAQLLMAAGLADVSPLALMRYLYYPYLLGLGALVSIWIGFPRANTR